MGSTKAELANAPGLLTSKEVARRLSISLRTLWRLVSAKRFPEPIRYNRKLVRWPASVVRQYLEDMAGGADPSPDHSPQTSSSTSSAT